MKLFDPEGASNEAQRLPALGFGVFGSVFGACGGSRRGWEAELHRSGGDAKPGRLTDACWSRVRTNDRFLSDTE
jgi:hypothetical protein